MVGLLGRAARVGVDVRLEAVVLVSRRAKVAAMRYEAAGSVRVSGALQAAEEELGANSAAREVVARLGQLQQAASRDT